MARSQQSKGSSRYQGVKRRKTANTTFHSAKIARCQKLAGRHGDSDEDANNAYLNALVLYYYSKECASVNWIPRGVGKHQDICDGASCRREDVEQRATPLLTAACKCRWDAAFSA
jgi:hypothetical protein